MKFSYIAACCALIGGLYQATVPTSCLAASRWAVQEDLTEPAGPFVACIPQRLWQPKRGEDLDLLLSSSVRGTLLPSSNLAIQEGEDLDLLLPSSVVYDAAGHALLVLGDTTLVSGNGEYAAKSEKDLLVYNSLGIRFHYIESPHIRKQLGLVDGEGILIQKIQPQSIGEETGLLAGDLVLRLGDLPVDTQQKFVLRWTENQGGETKARIKRNGVDQDLSFTYQWVADEDQNEEKNWYLGVSIDELHPTLREQLQTSGVVITSVTEDSPAQKAALTANDILAMVNGIDVENAAHLRELIQGSGGQPLTLGMIRKSRGLTVVLEPASRPQPQRGQLANLGVALPGLAIDGQLPAAQQGEHAALLLPGMAIDSRIVIPNGVQLSRVLSTPDGEFHFADAEGTLLPQAPDYALLGQVLPAPNGELMAIQLTDTTDVAPSTEDGDKPFRYRLVLSDDSEKSLKSKLDRLSKKIEKLQKQIEALSDRLN